MTGRGIKSEASEQLTLVVCTLDRPHCVERLLRATLEGDLVPGEILIVDASKGETYVDLGRRIAALESSRVQHLAVESGDRGLTRQRNSGIKAARGELIAFLDDDCVPSTEYFAELVSAAQRHSSAVGVGGWIDEGQWQPVSRESGSRTTQLRVEGWQRSIGARWRLRQRLGLAPPFKPGRVPPQGHGWPVAYLAPVAGDVFVDCFMGGASLWRRELFKEVGFSPWFEGYGLYEDQDFCLQARELGELVLAPLARVQHLHEAGGRPRPFHYGQMVVVNGWRVWRRGNPRPRLGARLRWWAVTALLAGVRAFNAVTGPQRRQALFEAFGRSWGAVRVIIAAPSLREEQRPPLSHSSSMTSL